MPEHLLALKCSSYKRVKGRSHTAEKQTSMHSMHKFSPSMHVTPCMHWVKLVACIG